MELPSETSKQIAFIMRPKIEEHIVIVMDKSTHDEYLCQPLQTMTNNSKFPSPSRLVIMIFLTLQTKITSFISRKQLKTKMVSSKYLSHLRNRSA